MTTPPSPHGLTSPPANASPDDLARLDLAPGPVAGLPSVLRRRVIAHLLRWEQYEAALACADAALRVAPDLVSLHDDRALALIGCGQPDAALEVLEARQALRESLTCRQLIGRAHLARGDAAAALSVAQRLVEEAPDAMLSRAFLAEALIAAGRTVEALAACHRLAALGPARRRYLLAMLDLYRRQGDLVSASAYAVRVEQSAAEGETLPAATLRRLHAYYRESGETHRAMEIAAALERLHKEELVALGDALRGGARDDPAAVEVAPENECPAPDSIQPPARAAVAVAEAEERAIRRAARDLFGFGDLRPGQLEALAAALRGQDVLAVMPTGGGKSLCYQLPAFLDPSGLTLVISPLIALMKDQVESLPAALRPLATTINSALDGDRLRQAIADVAAGRYRLVYAAPERLRQPPFLHALRCARVNRLVVDEAHCISVWGHDFRPDYLFIGRARRDLGDPPLLALTATAPARVRQDIVRRMAREDGSPDGDMVVIAAEPYRPNLRLEAIAVTNADDRLRHLIALCRAIDGSGIVYADTRRRCEEIAAMLRQEGLDARHYHAGIADPAERAAVQEAFMSSEVRIIVATIAFGMGIDKANIRFVIHYCLPNSLESYYQEAGRAGRDGLPARCVLLHAPSDRATLTRRFRRDAITVDTLRAAYASVRRQLRGATLGRVSLDDVARDAEIESAASRVALSMLEEAGLLGRYHDAPRAATLRLRPQQGPPTQSPEGARLAALLAPARGARPESLTVDPLALATQCGIDPREWERHVLEWARAGWLSYRPAGRDPLVETFFPAREAAEHSIAAILDRHAAIQMQRIEEIAAYAHTRRCRHQYLARYLGGHASSNGAPCTTCDNCAPSSESRAIPSADDLPDEQEQLRIILRCVGETRHGRGAMTLCRILRGKPVTRGPRAAGSETPAMPPSAHRGALAFRTHRAVRAMVASLLANGLLSGRPLEHKQVLEITAAGRRALLDSAPLAPLLPNGNPAARPRADERAPALSGDEAILFERLRRWRLEVAREADVPPYVVAHDAVLRRIAAARPATAEALLSLRGVGPRTVARYGKAILGIVREA